MKKELLIGLGLILSASYANAQWANPTDKFTYGFTEGQAKTLTGTNDVQELESKGSSAVLGSPSSGMARLFIPANTAGAFVIDPAANTLDFIGSTDGCTKFSVYNTKISSPVVSATFTATFSNPDAQKTTYFFSMGTKDRSGNIYNNKNAIYTGANSGGALFNALRFSYNNNGVTLGNRTLGEARGTDVPLSGGVLKFGTAYQFVLYMNNSDSATKYKKAGTEYTVAPKSYHIWVTNPIDSKSVQYTYNGSADLVRPTETNATNGEDATIPVNASLNAFLFQAMNSRENNSSMKINGNIEIVSGKNK